LPANTFTLTAEEVTRMIQGAELRAGELGLAVVVAVVDAGGVMVGLHRMDGARPSSSQVASGKAYTSALFQRPTATYQETTAPGGGAFVLWNAFPGSMLPVGGGRPVLWQGACIGGIGVSGGTPEQDDELAEAGIVAALGGAAAS
jgi:uncharacterized protein GlcG (DUF336 family)